jgi:predicted aldo/keto reductase-like oxidoreductase
MPPVCRLGLATRGGSQILQSDAELALERGLNYWNWCGHSDGLSEAIAVLGPRRRDVVVAVQFQARSASAAEREFEGLLEKLRTDYIDILTMYYVESQRQWEGLTGDGGVWEYLDGQKRAGRLRMIGVTSHQRRLAARWAGTGQLDLLMVRYNAAHRGAETEIFPVAGERGIPVVTFTGLRWRALLRRTPDDPEGFVLPTAAECYRFCLANPEVAVALAAPGNRAELDHLLIVADDWQAPDPARLEDLRLHGNRVRRHGGMFP